MPETLTFDPEKREEALALIADLPRILDTPLHVYFAECKVDPRMLAAHRNDTVHDFVAGRVRMIGSAMDFFADAMQVGRQPMNHLPFLFPIYLTLYGKQ